MNTLDILTRCILEKNNAVFDKLFSAILPVLYDCDVIEEVVIFTWFKRSASNDDLKTLRKNVSHGNC